MLDRVRVRCGVCGSTTPATVLWAIADTCPACLNPLHVPADRGVDREPAGVASALRHAQAPRWRSPQRAPEGADHGSS